MIELEGYAFIDYDNLTVSWNIAKGDFCTIDQIDGYTTNMLSTFFAGRLSNDSMNSYWSEIAIEEIRAKFFPHCTSRLLGLFIFEKSDQTSLEHFRNSDFFGKNHFSDQYLSRVKVSTSKGAYSKHDFNWIELIINEDGSLTENWEENAKKYWMGDPCSNQNPIWETIVRGHVYILDKKIIQEAILNISSTWPNTFFIFGYSLLASTHHIKNNEGLIVPIVTKHGSYYKLSYYSSEQRIHDDTFLSYLDNSIFDKFFSEYHHYFNLENFPNGENRVPDLSGFEKYIPCNMVKHKNELPYIYNIKLSYSKAIWKNFIDNNLALTKHLNDFI